MTSTVQPLPSILYCCVSLHCQVYHSGMVCRRAHSVGVRRRMRGSGARTTLFCSQELLDSVGDFSANTLPLLNPLARCRIRLSFATVVKRLVLPSDEQGSRRCSVGAPVVRFDGFSGSRPRIATQIESSTNVMPFAQAPFHDVARKHCALSSVERIFFSRCWFARSSTKSYIPLPPTATACPFASPF